MICRQEVTDSLCIHGVATLEREPNCPAQVVVPHCYCHCHCCQCCCGQVLVWRVDCCSPASISLVQLSLPAGNSVVDTGFYTSEFLSLLIEGDAQQEGQTLTHLPLVSLAPFMVSSSASGSSNLAIHQVNQKLW